MRSVLAMSLLVFAVAFPVAVFAQSATDIQSQMVTLLQQIIALQKTLIETLQNQINQLSSQITTIQNRYSQPQVVIEHQCSVVTPPACTTKLMATYDSYN